mgnify:FL=1
MFKLLNIDIKNHKDLGIFPGFNINEPEIIKYNSKTTSNIEPGDKVVPGQLFDKFFTAVDETNNNSSRKKKLHSIKNKSSKYKKIYKNKSKKIQKTSKKNKSKKIKHVS